MTILGIGNDFVNRLASEPVRQLASREIIRQTGKPANWKTGFSLIEVLLAVTILSIGIMGVLRAYSVSADVMQTAGYSIDAVCLLKEKMADIEQDVIENEGIEQGTYTGKFGGPYKDFSWVIEVMPLDLYPDEEDLKVPLNTLRVTVMNSYVKPVRRFRLVTYVENRTANSSED